MTKALLVIAKRPQPGQTKTRLSPPLTPQQATRLYECFLRDTLALVTTVPNVTRFILYAPANEPAYFAQLGPHFELLAQQGANLGERLDNALTHCLSNGFEQAVIVNSDGPTLPPAYLAQAFQQLDQTEAVFGPAEDGGYYLVGLTRPQPALLRQVQMSTPTVLQDTLALARRYSVETSLLPIWYDVDAIDDLYRLWRDLQSQPPEIARFTRAYFDELVTQIVMDKPKTQNPKPETQNPKPKTRNQKPKTQNPKLKTRNPKPKTQNPKLKTQNLLGRHHARIKGH